MSSSLPIDFWPSSPCEVVVPAAVASGAIACLDPAFSAVDWEAFKADASLVARGLGLEHFITRSCDVAPYCSPNASTPNHRHHLLNVLGRAKAARNRAAQYLLAVIPDADTWQMVQYFGLVQHAISVECVRGHLLLAATALDRFAALERALTSLNVKLGRCNTIARHLGAPLSNTLIVGAAITRVPGLAAPTYHCAIVATVDHDRARWVTDTSIQLAQTHSIQAIGRMFLRVLELLKTPIARMLYIRSAIPPYRLETTINYERHAIEDSLRNLNGAVPRMAMVVPWGPDEDASSADDYETTSVVGQSFAVPFNDFGHGWDVQAIGKLLSTLTFDHAYDNSPTAFPAPLKYASAASATYKVHFLAGQPPVGAPPARDYREVSRIIAQTPYWL